MVVVATTCFPCKSIVCLCSVRWVSNPGHVPVFTSLNLRLHNSRSMVATVFNFSSMDMALDVNVHFFSIARLMLFFERRHCHRVEITLVTFKGVAHRSHQFTILCTINWRWLLVLFGCPLTDCFCSGILNEVTIDSFVPFLLYGRLLQRHALGSRRVSSCVWKVLMLVHSLAIIFKPLWSVVRLILHKI